MEKLNLVIDKEQKKVFLDGEIVGSVKYIYKDTDMCNMSLHKLNRLSDLTVSDFFSRRVKYLKIDIGNDFLSQMKQLAKSDSFILISEGRKGELMYNLNLHQWAYSFNFISFFNRLKASFSDYDIIQIKEEKKEGFTDLVESKFLIYVDIDLEKNIKPLCNEVIKILKSKIDSVISELTNENDSSQEQLSNTFTFPPEIQNSCEQYLIYFVTFLKDIGINAETNIESKAQSTLFTVIPENGEEALEKIKEALQIYLHLPENPEFESTVNEFTDISVQKLASQVYFYKSQLALANTMLQLKDEKIESLNMMNYQETVIVESHQIEEKNEEKVLGGLVTITEFKLNGLTVNSPEMIRFFKRLFSKK